MPYRRVREQGIIFYFKYDDRYPELLHIYVRHLTGASGKSRALRPAPPSR